MVTDDPTDSLRMESTLSRYIPHTGYTLVNWMTLDLTVSILFDMVIWLLLKSITLHHGPSQGLSSMELIAQKKIKNYCYIFFCSGVEYNVFITTLLGCR